MLNIRHMKPYENNPQYEMMKAAVRDVLAEKEREKEETAEKSQFDKVFDIAIAVVISVPVLATMIVAAQTLFNLWF